MSRAFLSNRREWCGVGAPGKMVFERVPAELHNNKNQYVAPAA